MATIKPSNHDKNLRPLGLTRQGYTGPSLLQHLNRPPQTEGKDVYNAESSPGEVQVNHRPHEALGSSLGLEKRRRPDSPTTLDRCSERSSQGQGDSIDQTIDDAHIDDDLFDSFNWSQPGPRKKQQRIYGSKRSTQEGGSTKNIHRPAKSKIKERSSSPASESSESNKCFNGFKMPPRPSGTKKTLPKA